MSSISGGEVAKSRVVKMRKESSNSGGVVFIVVSVVCNVWFRYV